MARATQPYSQREALGQRWLRDLDGGKYREEFYVAHLEIAGKDNAVMLTTTHVLSISYVSHSFHPSISSPTSRSV